MKKDVNYLIIFMALILLFTINLNNVDAAKLPEGSKIGNISVEKIDEKDVKQKLTEEIELWQSSDDIVLKSEFEKIIVPKEVFEFDLDKTLQTFNEQTKRKLDTFFLKRKNVHLPLYVKVNENHEKIKQIKEKDYINFEQTMENIINLAKVLDEKTIPIIYNEDEKLELEEIVKIEKEIPTDLSGAVVSYSINELNDYIIPADDAFSFIQTVELPDKMTRSTEELSFIASLLYEAMLQTNFEIVSRKSFLHKPSYIADGLDVYVNPDETIDFITKNNHEFSIKINAKQKNDKLQLSLHSSPLDLTYTYELKDKETIKPRTIYRYSKRLAPGEEEIVVKGKNGFMAQLIRHSYNKRDVYIDSEFISDEFALPTPEIILLSSHAVEAEELVEDEEVPLEESIEKTIQELIEEKGLSDEVINIDGEIDRMEQEVERLMDDAFNELYEKILSEFKEYIESTEKVFEFIDDKELNHLLEELEEQLDEGKHANNNKRSLYNFLIQLLAKKDDEKRD